MYFKVSKGSETGAKIEKVRVLLSEHRAEQKALAEKYGFKEWQVAVPGRQIVGVFFEQGIIPDDKLWRNSKSNDGFVPRANRKQGKKLREELRAPQVWPDDINGAIGIFDEWSTIGIDWTNPNYYLIEVPEDMEFTPSEDVIEITSRVYKSLQINSGAA